MKGFHDSGYKSLFFDTFLGVVTTSVGKEIGYGDFACFSKDRLDEDTNSTENTCKQQTSQETYFSHQKSLRYLKVIFCNIFTDA